MFDPIMSVEVMELTTLIYKGNNLAEVPVVYQMEGGGALFVNITRGGYRCLLLPFYYKNQPVIFK